MYTKEQIEKITEDYRVRVVLGERGLEMAKSATNMQKMLVQDAEYKERCRKNLIVAVRGYDLIELKYILAGMFPISMFYLEDAYIEEFARIYNESMCEYGGKYFAQKFIDIYERYGYMGLYSNIGKLRRELKVKYVKENKINYKKDKSQFQEVKEYEKFMLGKGGDLMAEEYKRLGIK